MTDPQDATPCGPYATAAATYWTAGWRGILPLPTGQKAPVPNGWTGRDGTWPSYPDLQAWIEDRGAGNLALRLPPGVLGIDVDHYGGKPGGLVFESLETSLGALPATWRTTSRDDGISGIRLYRIPEGLRWPGVLGPGIETIRTEHRYAVAWPSVHPNGGTYRWITPNGATALGVVPTIEDLPHLPDAWIEHFTHGELATDQPHADLTDTAAGQWLTQRGAGAPCRHVDSALNRARADLLTASSRHDTTLQATNRLIWLAGEGHTGSAAALTQLRATFLAAVAGDRPADDAAQEWDRMIAGAVRIAAAAHPLASPDPCDDPFHGLIPKEQQWTPTSTTPFSSPSSASPTASTTSPSSWPTPPDASDSQPTSPPPTTDDARPSKTATDPPVEHLDPHLLELFARAHEEKLLGDVADLQRRRAAQRILDDLDHEQAVADRIRSLQIGERAQREWKRLSAGAQEPPAPISLTDLLATPDDPVRYRVEGVWPAGGRVVLAASAKAGKSTTVGNLVRSLADGDAFLGTFEVAPPPGRIILLDNELDQRQIKNWLRAQGITNTDAVYIVPLRGKLSTFDILDPIIRQEWAAVIRSLHGSIVIFDCLRPLIDALGLSEDKDAGRVLVAFDALLADSGADEGLVVHHMGHSGERSRGDTRIRDWPDAEWKIVKQKNDDGDTDDNAPRFFSAFGRDVAIPEAQLEFEPAARRLVLAGGSRSEVALKPVLDDLVDLLAQRRGGLSGYQIEGAMKESEHGRNEVRKAYKLGVEKGLFGTMPGPRNGTIYYLNEQTYPQPAEAATGQFATTSPPPNGEVSDLATADPLKGGSARWHDRPAHVTTTTSEVARSRTSICRICGKPLTAAEELTGATNCTGCTKKHRPIERTLSTGDVYHFDPITRQRVNPETGELT